MKPALRIKRLLHRFAAGECGAVTVEHIVLVAALIGLGVSTVSCVRLGTTSLANKTSHEVRSTPTGAQ